MTFRTALWIGSMTAGCLACSSGNDSSGLLAPVASDAGYDVGVTEEASASCLSLAMPDAGEPTLCSVASSSVSNTIILVNDCSTTTLEVDWVDTTCAEKSYGLVAPGQTLGPEMGSFSPNVWRIHLPNGGALLKEVDLTSSGTTVVTVP